MCTNRQGFRELGKYAIIAALKGANLSRFEYLARSKTTRTDFDVANNAVLYRPNPLQIGIPSPFGFVICVANIMPRLRAFPAYLANLRHYFVPPNSFPYKAICSFNISNCL